MCAAKKNKIDLLSFPRLCCSNLQKSTEINGDKLYAGGFFDKIDRMIHRVRIRLSHRKQRQKSLAHSLVFFLFLSFFSLFLTLLKIVNLWRQLGYYYFPY